LSDNDDKEISKVDLIKKIKEEPKALIEVKKNETDHKIES
jgi:hypothetical protein